MEVGIRKRAWHTCIRYTLLIYDHWGEYTMSKKPGGRCTAYARIYPPIHHWPLASKLSCSKNQSWNPAPPEYIDKENNIVNDHSSVMKYSHLLLKCGQLYFMAGETFNIRKRLLHCHEICCPESSFQQEATFQSGQLYFMTPAQFMPILELSKV